MDKIKRDYTSINYIDLVIINERYLQEKENMTMERRNKISKRARETGKEVENELDLDESTNNIMDKIMNKINI